jgi:hypothetical protein
LIDNWNERLEELQTFLEKEKRRPQLKSEKSLTNWINNTKENYKYYKKSMKNEIKRKLWEKFIEKNKEYFKTLDETWNDNLQKLQIFLDKEKRRPTIRESLLGNWVTSQISIYKITGFKDNINRCKQWELFIEKNKEYFKTDDEIWLEKIKLLQSFINMHERRPSPTENLHSWLSHQIENKDKFNKERYEYFIKFLEINKEYIKFNHEIWDTKFIDLKNFITEYKRRPNKRSKEKEERSIGIWLGNQNKEYNKKKLTQNRMKQWEEFLQEYCIYLKDINEIWDSNFIKLKKFLNDKEKRPNPSSKDKNENFIGRWFGTNQTDYIKKEHGMKDENRYKQWKEFLQEYGIYFKTDDEIWYDNLNIFKLFLKENNRKPKETIKEENKLRKWFTTHQKNYELKLQGFKDNPDRCKLWEDFLEEYKEYLTPKKSMKLNLPSEPTESSEHRRIRVKSELSVLHQQYKTMRSDTLAQHWVDHPTAWHDYHRISETNEETFPSESIPRNQIIRELEKIKTKRPKRVLDLGCGKALIAEYFHAKGDTRFQFTNIDHVAINETVQVGDISKLPFEDDSVEICILSLAMWGSNCKEYIQEVHRVLETNGILYIIEPTKRWTETETEPAGRLREWLKDFHIRQESIEKFTFFVAMK